MPILRRREEVCMYGQMAIGTWVVGETTRFMVSWAYTSGKTEGHIVGAGRTT